MTCVDHSLMAPEVDKAKDSPPAVVVLCDYPSRGPSRTIYYFSFVIYCSVGRTSIEIEIRRKLCLFGQYIVSASLNLQLSGNPCWYHYFAISIGNCFSSTHTSRMFNQQKYRETSNCADDLFLKCETWPFSTRNI